MKRLLLQKAHVFNPLKHNPSAWYVSEKLDGVRCLWDGGITRGMLASEVPWANTFKDGRYIGQIRATGLWTFYGKTVQAPASFLDQLPNFPLDGELWYDRGKFQDTLKIVKQLEPDARWSKIKFMVLDAPSYREIFCDGEIDLKGSVIYKKKFSGFDQWCYKRARTDDKRFLTMGKKFCETLDFLKSHPLDTDNLQLLVQVPLAHNRQEAENQMNLALTRILDQGGEGVVIRNPGSMWVPARVNNVLKYKPYTDDEATVIGYIWGKETDLGSKLLGLMGAMLVEWNGKRFKLSGFTDEERQMNVCDIHHPGESVPDGICNPRFPRGSRVTFKYRELSDDGIPKEARFHRIRDEV